MFVNLRKIYESKLNAKGICELKLNARIYDNGRQKGEAVTFRRKRAIGESFASSSDVSRRTQDRHNRL